MYLLGERKGPFRRGCKLQAVLIHCSLICLGMMCVRNPICCGFSVLLIGLRSIWIPSSFSHCSKLLFYFCSDVDSRRCVVIYGRRNDRGFVCQEARYSG
jgi:hypothetical protein